MEREVGGGIGMGNTCKPMAVSFKCMTKSTTNKKKKKKKIYLMSICNYNLKIQILLQFKLSKNMYLDVSISIHLLGHN